MTMGAFEEQLRELLPCTLGVVLHGPSSWAPEL